MGENDLHIVDAEAQLLGNFIAEQGGEILQLVRDVMRQELHLLRIIDVHGGVAPARGWKGHEEHGNADEAEKEGIFLIFLLPVHFLAAQTKERKALRWVRRVLGRENAGRMVFLFWGKQWRGEKDGGAMEGGDEDLSFVFGPSDWIEIWEISQQKVNGRQSVITILLYIIRFR